MSRGGYGSQFTDTATFTALLNELKTPLTGAAATLSKSATPAQSVQGVSGGRGLAGDDLRKMKFSELAERFEHLSQVLPDMLKCVQEIKTMQSSVGERVEILERRQQSEEAYLASLQELQEAVRTQAATLYQNIRDSMVQLRNVLDEREHALLARVKEVENEKITTIERQRNQCITVVENMRAAIRQSRTALADEDMTVWLDNGRQIEQMLTEQNALKIDYGPSPDLRFGCTLTVDLQRRILEVIDFDEKKGPGSPSKLGTASGGMIASSYKANPLTMTGSYGAGSGNYGAALGSQAGGGVAGLMGMNALKDMTLPDGTDYATFRRSLLDGTANPTSLFRESPMGLGRTVQGNYSQGMGLATPGMQGLTSIRSQRP